MKSFILKFDNNHKIEALVSAGIFCKKSIIKECLKERKAILVMFLQEQRPFLWNEGVEYDVDVAVLGRDMKVNFITGLKSKSTSLKVLPTLSKYILFTQNGVFKDIGMEVGVVLSDIEDVVSEK